MTVINDQYEFAEGTGPYIPISECITGVRAADSQSSFTFDPNDIVIEAKSTFEGPEKAQQYLSHPQIRINNVDLSENESNVSDEECKSLNASHSNIARYGNIPESWSLARSYVRPSPQDKVRSDVRASGSGNRLQIKPCLTKAERVKPHGSPRKIEFSEEGPPVPPRPPKSQEVSFSREHRESFQGPKIKEPERDRSPPFPWVRSSRNMSRAPVVRQPQADDDACCLTHVRHRSLQQYCNLSSFPPIVDRALKPRIPNSGSNCHLKKNVAAQTLLSMPPERVNRRVRTSDTLQYLELDLTPSNSNGPEGTSGIHRAKPIEARADYNTVDFVKTEAFNITRQDAEASRNVQQ